MDAAQAVPAELRRCDVMIRQADAAALSWPDGSIDLLVTSPAYPPDEIRHVRVSQYRDYARNLERIDRWAATMLRQQLGRAAPASTPRWRCGSSTVISTPSNPPPPY